MPRDASGLSKVLPHLTGRVGWARKENKNSLQHLNVYKHNGLSKGLEFQNAILV